MVTANSTRKALPEKGKRATDKNSINKKPAEAGLFSTAIFELPSYCSNGSHPGKLLSYDSIKYFEETIRESKTTTY